MMQANSPQQPASRARVHPQDQGIRARLAAERQRRWADPHVR